MMYTHSLFPNITKPTRIYGKSSTLIDNIFSNDLLGTTQTLSGILETDISDHYPIFHIVDMSLYPKENLYQKCRSVTDENTSKFIDALNSQDWTNILSCSDAQKAYTSFHVELSRLYNACFPIKYIKQGSGLDTNFFLNLSVGQPSNNMDLSEIEIYLGTMMIFFFFRKKSGRTVYLLYIQFLFQDYCVWSTLSHNKSLVFFSRSFFCPFWRHRDQEYFSRDIRNI